jgi:hypothetical protein
MFIFTMIKITIIVLLHHPDSLAFMPKLWLVKASVADVLASPRSFYIMG